MQSLQLLSDIYTHLSVPSPPPLPSPPPFPNHPPLNTLLTQLPEHNPAHTYPQLAELINQLEEEYGPKQFQRTITTITTHITTHASHLLRMQKVDKMTIHLNFFLRCCQTHLTPLNALPLKALMALGHLRKGTPRNAIDNLITAKTWAQEEKSWDHQAVITAIEGQMLLELGDTVKAKWALNQLVIAVTTHIEQEQGTLTFITKNCFVLSTYFLARVHIELGNKEVSQYHLTQAVNFALNNLKTPGPFVSMCQQKHTSYSPMIKLSRIENKIERVKSLYGLTQPKQQPVPYKRKTSFKVREKKDIKGQLENILMVQEGNDLRLKKRTLKAIKGQRNEKEEKISHFESQINVFRRHKDHIKKHYDTETQHKQLARRRQEKAQLQANIYAGVWRVLPNIRPTSQLNAYLKGFAQAVNYLSNNRLLRAFCSDVSFNAKVRLFGIFRRIRQGLTRTHVRQIVIDGVMHQMELLKRQKTSGFVLRVYKIELGKGIEQQLQISESVYLGLREFPLEFFFERKAGKLTPLQDYISSLSPGLFCKIMLFAVRMRRQLQVKKQQVTLTKKTLTIDKGLVYILFVSNTRLADGTFRHTMERIDTRHYHKDYDMPLDHTWEDESSTPSDRTLLGIVRDKLLELKVQHSDKVMRLQRRVKMFLAWKLLQRRKHEGQSSSLFQSQFLYTLVSTPTHHAFYIEKPLQPELTAKLPTPSFTSLAFVPKIAEELSPQLCPRPQHALAVIKKFFKLRSFVQRFIAKSKEIQLNTTKANQFKRSFCMVRRSNKFLYQGRVVKGKVVFVMRVLDFETIPRPYLLRIFTIEPNPSIPVDISQTIYNNDKVFIESNANNVHLILDVQDKRSCILLRDGERLPLRDQSKTTVKSAVSLASDLELMPRLSRASSRQRESSRYLKSSKHFKTRHKSAFKQREVVMLKRWIDQNDTEREKQRANSKTDRAENSLLDQEDKIENVSVDIRNNDGY